MLNIIWATQLRFSRCPLRADFARWNVDRIYAHYRHRYILYEWRVSLASAPPGEPATFQVPHAIVIVSDTITPPEDCLLRSEVLMAARILREATAQAFWVQHVTHPVGASINL